MTTKYLFEKTLTLSLGKRYSAEAVNKGVHKPKVIGEPFDASWRLKL